MVGVSTEIGKVMEQVRVREEPEINSISEPDAITTGVGTEGEIHTSGH